MEELLLGGTHVVVDRYAYSGVAYSAAKNVSGMGREWCAAPDSGLIAPDAVIFLEILPKGAEARGGYGQERYEVLELQQLVAKEFKQLEDDRFAVIDGSQTVDEVSQEVYAVAEAVMNKCHSESIPLGTLWEPPAFSVTDTLQNSKTI